MNLKCTYNSNVICVFSVIEDITTHLGNIDLRNNCLYTTRLGYDLIADNCFKSNHTLQFLDFGDLNREWSVDDLVSKKFDAVIMFTQPELNSVIKMCSRTLTF